MPQQDESVPNERRKKGARSRELKTMNSPKKPIDWPLASPLSLSEDARTMYGGGSQRKLDRDYFDRRARNGYVSREDQDKYEPTTRDLAAIAEIEAAGLGRYSAEYKTLYLTPVDAAYTVAEGRGSQLIRVYLYDAHLFEKRLLAVLVGGDLESKDSRSGSMPELCVRSRHEDGTDFEHDASSTAILRVVNPTQPTFAGYGRVEFDGLLVEARLYPLGTDVLTVSDADTEAGSVCDDGTCKKPHPFVPFQPPEAEGLRSPQIVHVECVPIRSYAVSARMPAAPAASTPEPEGSETAS